jgi:hypothetical protein
MSYEVREQAIKQMRENLQLNYNHLNQIVTRNMNDAKAREEALFADGGAISTLLAAGGLGAFTGILGLLRKRPGDMTKDDFQRAVEPIQAQIGMKDQQFAQVVTGVEKFLKSKEQIAAVFSKDTDAAQKTDELLEMMKTFLGKSQDASTQQEVAKVRVTV